MMETWPNAGETKNDAAKTGPNSHLTFIVLLLVLPPVLAQTRVCLQGRRLRRDQHREGTSDQYRKLSLLSAV